MRPKAATNARTIDRFAIELSSGMTNLQVAGRITGTAPRGRDDWKFVDVSGDPVQTASLFR
jgi:hypothetical protein